MGRAGRLRVRLMKKGANLGGGDTHGQLGRQNQEPLGLGGGSSHLQPDTPGFAFRAHAFTNIDLNLNRALTLKN